LVELVVTEFGWTTGSGIIVERGLEAALFEAIQTIVDSLSIPAVLLFDLVGRESFQVLAGGSKTFDRLRISLVRELLADSRLCEVWDLFPPPSSYQPLSLQNLKSFG
jgi:hypothetical protein